MVDFSLTEQQQAVRRTSREFAANEFDPVARIDRDAKPTEPASVAKLYQIGEETSEIQRTIIAGELLDL